MRDAKPKVFVDADQAELQPLVARKRRRLAEGSRHDETLAERAHPQRCGIGAAGAAADMVQDAKDRHPPPSGDQHDSGIYKASSEADHATSAWPHADRVDCLVSRDHVRTS